jgi:hypothetical protein
VQGRLSLNVCFRCYIHVSKNRIKILALVVPSTTQVHISGCGLFFADHSLCLTANHKSLEIPSSVQEQYICSEMVFFTISFYLCSRIRIAFLF